MAAGITAIQPSGGNNGKLIASGNAFGSRKVLHEADASTLIQHEVYIVAHNTDVAEQDLILVLEDSGGETEDAGRKLTFPIAGGASSRVMAGHRITGSVRIAAYDTNGGATFNLQVDVQKIDQTT